MPKDDSQPMIQWQVYQGGINLATSLPVNNHLFRGCGNTCSHRPQSFLPLSSFQPVQRFINRHSINPAKELVAGVETGKLLICFHEDCLSNVRGFVVVADDPYYGVKNRFLVPINEATVSLGFSIQAIPDQLQLALFSHKYKSLMQKLVKIEPASHFVWPLMNSSRNSIEPLKFYANAPELRESRAHDRGVSQAGIRGGGYGPVGYGFAFRNIA